ncbi:MAG: hypothetical protein HYU48_00735 [Candidatus Levybacteria bacterium]|nr:hypothetical protein [Candidatus Levybacteria bacterium]
MIETMAALTCQLAGVDPVNPNQKCLGIDQKNGQIGFVENGGGAIGLMGKAITMLYTPPASSGQYLQNLASNFGLVKPAQAQLQETGFKGLSPLLGIWSTFRNMVYLLFVLIFVIIGIAIMLRVKIDPRTVMTVQNQIPKIIVGILLVTFSFAIAGFLIDLMYTSIYLTGNAIVATDSKITEKSLVVDIASSTNPFSAANRIGGATGGSLGLSNIAWEPAKSVGGYIAPIFDNAPGKIITGIVMGVVGKFVVKGTYDVVGGILTAVGLIGGTAAGGPAGAIAGAAIGSSIANFIVSLIAFLVISIALLFALFRLWFALISAYIFLLLDVVTAPFWIFAGLIPGSSISFGLWLRDIISNLAAFPTAIIMFLLARVFIDAFGTTQAAGQFVPPLIGNPSATNAIGALIGLGFILLTPRVVEMTKAALKAPKFDTTPIKQAIGVGTGAPGAIVGQGSHLGSTLFGISNLPGVRSVPMLNRLLPRAGGHAP